ATYSGRALSIMPVGLLCILWFLNRSYVMEFFNKATLICGVGALAAAVVLIIIGSVIMSRIANVEV
ncbi:MAG TPA: hypothetical protein VII93_11675, partial [Anaerolineales bacterium]